MTTELLQAQVTHLLKSEGRSQAWSLALARLINQRNSETFAAKLAGLPQAKSAR